MRKQSDFLLLIKSNLTLQNWMAKSPYTNTHPPLWIRLWSCKSIHFTCLSIITTLGVIFRNTRDRSIRRYMITTHAYWWKTFHFVRVDRDTGIYPPVDYKKKKQFVSYFEIAHLIFQKYKKYFKKEENWHSFSCWYTDVCSPLSNLRLSERVQTLCTAFGSG